MNISIIGLGLIGGSLCKSIKKNTEHTVLGYDIDKATVDAALNDGSIDKSITTEELGLSDLTIVCLHPRQTINFILNNADKFKKGSIVSDVCGVKEAIVSAVENTLLKQDITFVGAHPMAGREFSGYEYCTDNLFDGASYIITKTENTPKTAINALKTLAEKLNFAKIVITDVKTHDNTIAYTSQLAHVVSNAYVKTPTLQNESGFSANSFLDLTRVAKLNEDMWTDLFMLNKEPLIREIGCIIDNINKYKEALENEDSEYLKKLLKEGRVLKEESLKVKN